MKIKQGAVALMATVLISTSLVSNADASGKYLYSGKYEKGDRIADVSIRESLLQPAFQTIPGYKDVYLGAKLPSSNASTPYEPLVKIAVSNFYSAMKKEGINIQNLFADGTRVFCIREVNPGILGHSFAKNSTVFLFSSEKYTWNQSLTTTSLYHEFGHLLQERYFSDADMKAYMDMRGIPRKWSSSSANWRVRPNEVFAEDFIQLFGNQKHYHNKTAALDMDSNMFKQVKSFIISTIKKKTNVTKAVR